MLKPPFTKRGRPPRNKRYCSTCARPKDATRPEWLLLAEVRIDGEPAFKVRTRESRPVVCDRCGRKTNDFYEVRPDKPLLTVEEIEVQDQREGVIFALGMGLGFGLGIISTFLFLAGATDGFKSLVAFFSGLH